MPEALIVDHQLGAGLAAALGEVGLDVTHAPSGEAGLERLAAARPVICLVAADLADLSPLGFLASALELYADLPVVVTDRCPDLRLAVAAIRAGAIDYLACPLDGGQLAEALRLAGHPVERVADLPRVLDARAPFDPAPRLIGTSTCVRNVKQLVATACRTGSPVFVSGPSGTGKELVAEAIHRSSGRRDGPFVPVNCGALPEGLAEGELFGAAKGAYTGAGATREGLIQAADGGTLFLDELGEMAPALQVKLLRFLQQRAVRPVGTTAEVPVDVRVVAATNRDPLGAVRDGSLREDLYYRLAVVRINLEPLARRREDIQPICEHLLTTLRQRYGTGPSRISDEALAALERHDWPGNVRELENVLDLTFAMGEAADVIEVEHLPPDFDDLLPRPPEASKPPPEAMPTLRDAELVLIQRAMARSNGNKAQAARLLGISRPYLYRRLRELEGDPPPG